MLARVRCILKLGLIGCAVVGFGTACGVPSGQGPDWVGRSDASMRDADAWAVVGDADIGRNDAYFESGDADVDAGVEDASLYDASDAYTDADDAADALDTGAADADAADAVTDASATDAAVTDAADAGDATVPPPSYAFWDQGFSQGVVRSDLGDIRTVSIGSCLYPDPDDVACPAGLLCSRCPTGPSTYTRSNFFSTVQPAPTTYFWTLDHNVDVGEFGGAFNNSCNSGPPDQSLPVGAGPMSGEVFDFWLSGGSTGGRRAHLGITTRYGPCPNNAVPYLGLGVSARTGNRGKVGRFQRSTSAIGDIGYDQSWVRFSAAIEQCQGLSPCLFYLNAQTRWGGKPRMIIVTLGHLNHRGEHGVHAHWNWPVEESHFNNGYDIAYVDCEGLGLRCLDLDPAGQSYHLSVGALMSIASDFGLYDDPIPVGQILELDAMSWSIETAGADAQVGAWVERMEITGPPAAFPALFFGRQPSPVTRAVTLSPSESLYGRVENIGRDDGISCLEIVGRPADQLNGDGWCKDPANWTPMVSSSEPNRWRFSGGTWTLAIQPVGSIFVANTYRGYWRDRTTGATARAEFTVE